MNLQPHRYIVISQFVLGLSILSSLIIIPHYFFSLDQGGISNYGTEQATRWLYLLGFAVAGAGAVAAGLSLPHPRIGKIGGLRTRLYLLSLLYFLGLLSTFPYKLNQSYRHLHELVAVILFWLMLEMSIWLRTVSKDRHVDRAFIIFSIGFLAAALTFVNLFHILFTAQIICGVSFAYILVRGVSLLNKTF